MQSKIPDSPVAEMAKYLSLFVSLPVKYVSLHE